MPHSATHAEKDISLKLKLDNVFPPHQTVSIPKIVIPLKLALTVAVDTTSMRDNAGLVKWQTVPSAKMFTMEPSVTAQPASLNTI